MTCRPVESVEVGDNLYCTGEGWSGEVVEILADDLTGEPCVAILRSHDPDDGPWLAVPFSAYLETDGHGGIN